jgi:hypothetical protein
MMHRLIWIAAVGLLACGRAAEAPPRIVPGMTKADVVMVAGEPASKQVLVRNVEHIWGPVEEVWYQLQPGEQVEIWRYEGEGEFTEVFFLRGSDTVHSTGTYPEGVVF